MKASVFRAQDAFTGSGHAEALNNLRVLDAFGVAGRDLLFAFEGPRLSELGAERPRSSGAWRGGRVLASPRAEKSDSALSSSERLQPRPPAASPLAPSAAQFRRSDSCAFSDAGEDKREHGAHNRVVVPPPPVPVPPCRQCSAVLDRLLGEMRSHYEARLRAQRLEFQRGMRSLVDRLCGKSHSGPKNFTAMDGVAAVAAVARTRVVAGSCSRNDDSDFDRRLGELDLLIRALETDASSAAGPIALSLSPEAASASNVMDSTREKHARELLSKGASRERLADTPGTLCKPESRHQRPAAPSSVEHAAAKQMASAMVGKEPELRSSEVQREADHVGSTGEPNELLMVVCVPTAGSPLTQADVLQNAQSVAALLEQRPVAPAETTTTSSPAIGDPLTEGAGELAIIKTAAVTKDSNERKTAAGGIKYEPVASRSSAVLTVTRRHQLGGSQRRSRATASQETQTDAAGFSNTDSVQ
jgi:hypothetical protein